MVKKKVTTLTAATTYAGTDLVPIVINPSTIPASRKITWDDIFTEIVTGVDIKTVNGIDFTPGSDADCDLLTVGVTGTPKLWWDESIDAFGLSKPLYLGGTQTTASVDPVVNVNRAVNDDIAGNGHCFSDSSVITRSGGVAYASYDARLTFAGTENYDHNAGFQSAPTLNTSGTITNLYGLSDVPVITAGAVTNRYGVYIGTMTGGTVGNVTKAYGVYVASLEGATAYSFYAAANNRVFFGDAQLIPGGTATGEAVAGFQIRTASGNVVLYPSSDLGVGDMVQICAYGNSAFKSVLQTKNKASTALPDANLVMGGGNVGVGTETHGTTASKSVTIATGVAPTASPADASQLYSADQAAGNACLHTRTENGAVIKLYQGAAVANPGAGEAEAKLIELLNILRAQGLIAT